MHYEYCSSLWSLFSPTIASSGRQPIDVTLLHQDQAGLFVDLGVTPPAPSEAVIFHALR